MVEHAVSRERSVQVLVSIFSIPLNHLGDVGWAVLESVYRSGAGEPVLLTVLQSGSGLGPDKLGIQVEGLSYIA